MDISHGKMIDLIVGELSARCAIKPQTDRAQMMFAEFCEFVFIKFEKKMATFF